MAGKSISVSIVSAERAVWSGEATMVSARTQIGEIGILAGHEPVLAILAEGTVRVTTTDGERIEVSAPDGFLSFDHDTLTVITRDAALV